MVHFTSFVLSAWVAQVASAKSSMRTSSRQLSWEKITGYSPMSGVTDHNALDRDQLHMQAALSEGGGTTSGFDKARLIYEQGGNSKSYAEIKLTGGLSDAIEKGDEIIGTGINGDEVRGTAYTNYAKDSRTIKVVYKISDMQEKWVMCRVGALQEEGRVTSGCLDQAKQIKIGSANYDFSYDYTVDNKNGRTLKGFSTSVQSKMIVCDPGCPFVDAEMFADYYGRPDYGDHWVESAFNGEKTSFVNGDADFTKFGFTGKTESIKKGTVYLNVFMYVIREFEDAIVDCRTECATETCNDAPGVHAWDEGVAFYAGSEEGQEGDNGGSKGMFLHQLADKRCENFGTCNADGLATVNVELYKLFDQGQAQINTGQCGEGRKTLKKITSLMYVPLIQGTLRYAYKVEQAYKKEPGSAEKEQAEGAVFAASILPRIHNVTVTGAKTIYDNMMIGGASETDFSVVKTTLESTYDELGITCDMVGGLLASGDSGAFVEDGKPCGTRGSGGTKLGLMVATLGSIVAAFSIF